jgi:transposase
MATRVRQGHLTTREAGRLYGLKPDTVRRYVRLLNEGYLAKPGRGRRRSLPAWRAAQWARRVSQGDVTVSEAARLAGVALETMRRYVAEFGGPQPPRRREPEPLEVIEWLPEAFERSGMSRTELAKRMGWGRATGNVARLLEHRRCRYSTALRLVEALGLDPVDVGL